MLELRPNCECCNDDLPPESADARICSFECTFCAACADTFDDICPNCSGELVARPRRPKAKLARRPTPTDTLYKYAASGANVDLELAARRRLREPLARRLGGEAPAAVSVLAPPPFDAPADGSVGRHRRCGARRVPSKGAITATGIAGGLRRGA